MDPGWRLAGRGFLFRAESELQHRAPADGAARTALDLARHQQGLPGLRKQRADDGTSHHVHHQPFSERGQGGLDLFDFGLVVK
jgi:hypothetical protein